MPEPFHYRVVITYQPGEAPQGEVMLEEVQQAISAFGCPAGAPFGARIQQYVECDGQGIVGPLQRYVCSRDDLKPFPIPQEINVILVEREDIPALYEYAQFHHALSYDVHSVRPDVLASVAEYQGHVVGIAGASADCDAMWQIGVDILAERDWMKLLISAKIPMRISAGVGCLLR